VSDTSLFASLAYPFLPADDGRRGAIVEADRDWSFDAAAIPPHADVVVWGRLPEGAMSLIGSAAAREATLASLGRRLPPDVRVAAVHRLPPRQLATGVRARLRAALRGGALVEIVSPAGGPRLLDAAAAAAGATILGGRFHVGAGGAVIVRARLAAGSDAILRVAQAGAPGDPARLGDTLQRLAGAGVPLAPRPLGGGLLAQTSWTVEQALPGRRPARATPGLVAQVAEAWGRFPRSEGPPTAPIDDLVGAARRLPERAAALRRLSSEVAVMLRELPAVLRHGDLWTGNLLVDGKRLAGVVDWDAAHPSGVAGSDLVQLVATDARRRARRHLGAAFLSAPWRSIAFQRATAGYWAALGTAPEPRLLEAAAIGWWATEVHHTLVRLPHRAADERWIASNVDPVLAALGCSPDAAAALGGDRRARSPT
jgi:phosphotransferase family enzyme